ncbi:hypothetical protein CRYUN_Cryun28dG0013200 [Craigia yunnanensis]
MVEFVGRVEWSRSQESVVEVSGVDGPGLFNVGFLSKGIGVQEARWGLRQEVAQEGISKGRNFLFLGCGIKSTIERYKKTCSDSSNTNTVTEINAQYYQQESAKLRQQIQMLQNSNRHLMGDSLSSLTVRELKQLENRLERGIIRIRSKKIMHIRVGKVDSNP